MKQKNLVLMGIAVGCGLVAAILTSQMGQQKPPEMVKMLVASKDMTTGTTFTKENVGNYTEYKEFPKNAINPEAKIIGNHEELVGKRLTRATHAGEFFNAADVNNKTQIMFESGKDIMSLPMSAQKAAAGFVGPGARVDIVGSVIEGQRREVFTLLADMHVLAVNNEQDLTQKSVFPDMSMISFAVTEAQAKLIALANQRNCNLELLLRHPDAPRRYPTQKDEQAAYDKTLNLLKNLGEKDNTAVQVGPEGPMKPPEEKKIEMVDVYVAKETIAPNTEITGDIVKEKFDKVQKPKEQVEGAVTNLDPFVGPVAFKAFTLGVAKGQIVLDTMIGPAPIKGSVGAKPPETELKLPPKEVVIEDMPPPPLPIAPMPHVYKEPTPPKPRIRDVALHTNRGTIVHRYQETAFESNEWKLVAILTPMEAAATPETTDKDKKSGESSSEKRLTEFLPGWCW
ncbi:MAG: Flp pilus assembly protein CpaB [Gemmataceae bacterium]